MKKFSQILAAAAVVVALAVSGSAWAETREIKDTAFKVKVILEGEILQKSANTDGTHHLYTIINDDKLYYCLVSNIVLCWEHS